MSSVCGQCEERQSVLKCLQCGEDFCMECSDKIHARGKLKSHSLMMHSELSASLNGGDGGFVLSISPVASPSKRSYRYSLNLSERCTKHLDERLAHFCMVDQQVVCAQCLLLGEHKGHTFQKLSVAFPRLKQQAASLEKNVELSCTVGLENKLQFETTLVQMKQSHEASLDVSTYWDCEIQFHARCFPKFLYHQISFVKPSLTT
eukprot:TRINITY_DN4097_c0_g1_i15.p1 TRINITY_DN4097_c0_g1~~TRINITY_DN4097_c0_g1_i15.p1  ORF type:complete len:204 (-),score=23.76 TRINITY_DN4097_c0_g1_i15:2965-3576(-)